MYSNYIEITGFRFLNVLRICLSQIFNVNENSVVEEKESFFINIVIKHEDIINRICRSFSSNDMIFEDLRQDTFINLWKGIESFKNNSDIKTWIYRITLNTCVSTYRKEKGKSTLPLQPYESSEIIEPEEYESAQWLKKALENLSPLDHAIMLMWLDDFSYEDISKVIGLNRNTVATRIKRAKEKIKNIIGKKNF